jgi:hypothetical protein
VSEPPQRPRRPAPFPDLTALIDAAGGLPEVVPSELAASTAAAVLAAGRGGDRSPRADVAVLIGLADSVGLDTLRALWGGADSVSLAGSLWALYLLRSWCQTNPAEVSRLWALGEPTAQADAVVAGVNMMADESAMAELADAILTGLFAGDVAVTLERASATFRVLAAGRRQLDSSSDAELAIRNERVADALAESARRWRTTSLR